MTRRILCVCGVARMAGRVLREREFGAIIKELNITVGPTGRCERDVIECVSLLYSNYVRALRDDYSIARPAQPVLFFDGTGSALGHGLCHGEMGCADFKQVGDADARQSRSNLQPLFAYQGNDHGDQLRANLELSITSYNKLVAQATFDRVTLKAGVSVIESILTRCIQLATCRVPRRYTACS